MQARDVTGVYKLLVVRSVGWVGRGKRLPSSVVVGPVCAERHHVFIDVELKKEYQFVIGLNLAQGLHMLNVTEVPFVYEDILFIT